MITIGIDIGSITAKAALMIDSRLIETKVGLTGYNPSDAAQSVYDDLLASQNIAPEDVDRVVSTGYGRANVKFADKSMSEIICHGTGAFFQNPDVRFLIDIGGQDSKVLSIGPNGKVKNFAMNDKCAAGTGRFLEVMARALQIHIDDLGPMSLTADQPAKISNICTVFAESEVISLIAKGESRPNIIAGLNEAIASRVAAMVFRVGLTKPVMMTGGVAKNVGVVKAFEDRLETAIQVLPSAQVNGAIGAAVMAMGL